jgi:H+-transporting ATPase
VPGDVIELKIGDVIPADSVLLDGLAVQVDQAALTGESLPVTVQPWGQVLMGSALKRGEVRG